MSDSPSTTASGTYEMPQGQGQPSPYPGAPGGHVPVGYAAPARNGLGIAALVLGIIGVVFGLIPLTAFVALILGILAIIFGLIGRARGKRGEATNKKMATSGFVLGLVSLALSIVGFVILVNAGNDLSNNLDCLSKANTTQQMDNCNK